MKKNNLISLLIILSTLPFFVTGCGEVILEKFGLSQTETGETGTSKLLEYSGKEYYKYLDTAFYNVIEAAPLINVKILDGEFNDNDVYVFDEIAYGEFSPNITGVIKASTKFENIYIFADGSQNTVRRYSIQNGLFSPEMYSFDEDTFYYEIYVNSIRNDEGVLSANSEDFDIMFTDNLIDKDQLEADYSGRKYSDIVEEFGSIGLLQYFYFNGEDEEDQDIRIMWYCPDEKQILSLYFNANNQNINQREISDVNGNIILSDFRMTTAEKDALIAEAKKAEEEERLAKIEAENQKFAGVNALRKQNDTVLSSASVGDIVTFGSYPFDNKWDEYISYADMKEVYSYAVDDYDPSKYDENELKDRYLLFVCGINYHKHYPGNFAFSDSIIPEGYEYTEAYDRCYAIHPWKANASDDELKEQYDKLITHFSDENNCYYDKIYPTFEDYKQTYINDIEAVFAHCPNRLFENYDDFKMKFEEYFAEQNGVLTTAYQPVQWKVLAIEDNRMLLLSDKVLFNKPFFIYNAYDNQMYGYEQSELRDFLNNDVYEVMFNDEEKSKIVYSDLENKDSAEYTTEYRMNDYSSGKHIPEKYQHANTQDRLFLLGYDEILKYCGELELISYPDPSTWGFTNVEEYGFNSLTTTMINKTDNSDWWLRNSNNYEYDRTLTINEYGVIVNALNKGGASRGVRPAMWVTIE